MNLGALSAKEKRVTGTTYISTRLVLDIVWGYRQGLAGLLLALGKNRVRGFPKEGEWLDWWIGFAIV